MLAIRCYYYLVTKPLLQECVIYLLWLLKQLALLDKLSAIYLMNCLLTVDNCLSDSVSLDIKARIDELKSKIEKERL